MPLVLLQLLSYVKEIPPTSSHIATVAKNRIDQWLEHARLICADPSFEEVGRKLYGGPAFVANNPTTYWTDPHQFFVWWKNNSERKAKFRELQENAVYVGPDDRKRQRAKWCEMVVNTVNGIKERVKGEVPYIGKDSELQTPSMHSLAGVNTQQSGYATTSDSTSIRIVPTDVVKANPAPVPTPAPAPAPAPAPPRLSSSTSTSTSSALENERNSDASSKAFVVILFHLVSDEAEDVVRWTDDGLSFAIIDAERFVQETMPKYFLTTATNQFWASLHAHGFLCRTIENRQFFTHPLFVRGRPDLAMLMSAVIRQYPQSMYQYPGTIYNPYMQQAMYAAYVAQQQQQNQLPLPIGISNSEKANPAIQSAYYSNPYYSTMMTPAYNLGVMSAAPYMQQSDNSSSFIRLGSTGKVVRLPSSSSSGGFAVPEPGVKARKGVNNKRKRNGDAVDEDDEDEQVEIPQGKARGRRGRARLSDVVENSDDDSTGSVVDQSRNRKKNGSMMPAFEDVYLVERPSRGSRRPSTNGGSKQDVDVDNSVAALADDPVLDLRNPRRRRLFLDFTAFDQPKKTGKPKSKAATQGSYIYGVLHGKLSKGSSTEGLFTFAAEHDSTDSSSESSEEVEDSSAVDTQSKSSSGGRGARTSFGSNRVISRCVTRPSIETFPKRSSRIGKDYQADIPPMLNTRPRAQSEDMQRSKNLVWSHKTCSDGVLGRYLQSGAVLAQEHNVWVGGLQQVTNIPSNKSLLGPPPGSICVCAVVSDSEDDDDDVRREVFLCVVQNADMAANTPEKATRARSQVRAKESKEMQQHQGSVLQVYDGERSRLVLLKDVVSVLHRRGLGEEDILQILLENDGDSRSALRALALHCVELQNSLAQQAMQAQQQGRGMRSSIGSSAQSSKSAQLGRSWSPLDVKRFCSAQRRFGDNVWRIYEQYFAEERNYVDVLDFFHRAQCTLQSGHGRRVVAIYRRAEDVIQNGYRSDMDDERDEEDNDEETDRMEREKADSSEIAPRKRGRPPRQLKRGHAVQQLVTAEEAQEVAAETSPSKGRGPNKSRADEEEDEEEEGEGDDEVVTSEDVPERTAVVSKGKGRGRWPNKDKSKDIKTEPQTASSLLATWAGASHRLLSRVLLKQEVQPVKEEETDKAKVSDVSVVASEGHFGTLTVVATEKESKEVDADASTETTQKAKGRGRGRQSLKPLPSDNNNNSSSNGHSGSNADSSIAVKFCYCKRKFSPQDVFIACNGVAHGQQQQVHSCGGWVHLKCAGLTNVSERTLKRIKEFVCRRCRDMLKDGTNGGDEGEEEEEAREGSDLESISDI